MDAIVVDPVGDRLYFAGGDGVEVINVDGTNRTRLANVSVSQLAVDLKAG